MRIVRKDPPDNPFKENIRPYIGLTAKGLYKALYE
jgi:hypothetical protein